MPHDQVLDAEAALLARMFTAARTHNAWMPTPVADETLQALYGLMKWGPTSANCSPARMVFLRSPASKARLRPALSPGNLAKTMAAPVTAILAYDLDFPDTLPQLFPHADARSWFVGQSAHTFNTAFRNGSLQGGYFILAARAVGLDCGPMSGFDAGKVDAEFFAGSQVKSNFLCNLGHGDPAGLYPRNARLPFDRVCTIL